MRWSSRHMWLRVWGSFSSFFGDEIQHALKWLSQCRVTFKCACISHKRNKRNNNKTTFPSPFIPGENPRIIEHPMDTTVPKNDPFTFNCKAEGNPTPSIQWFKDGRELKTDSGSHRIMLPAGGLFFLKVHIITNQLISIRLYHYGLQLSMKKEA